MRINANFSIPSHDRGKADDVYTALCDAAIAADDERGKHHIHLPKAQKLVSALAGNSPFLARCILAHKALMLSILYEEPEVLFQQEMTALESAIRAADGTDAVMRHLRRTKARIALLIAAADIASIWSLTDVAYMLSAFADKALGLALGFLLHDRMEKGDLVRPDGAPDGPDPVLAAHSGFFILAMGKLGANELNYSSDIDLIALYDGDVVRYTGKRTVPDCMVRLTQDLVRIMEMRTGEGYVFRTDLRLRPDPGATPLALSVGAAETYYQSLALNWERAAMIKARVCAGDIDAGTAFLERLSPFIWRRSLDYAAIEDIHAIKDQIHRHHHHGTFRLPGFDVKLGPGGIREIEFYAQINQLIAGGRAPVLRVPDTLGALAVLAAEKRIPDVVYDDLKAAYLFLRTLEHRLQMVNDAQTHRLPETDDGLLHIARFCGYADIKSLERTLSGHLSRVKQHYDNLLPHDFAQRETLDDSALRLLSTDLGYKEPDSVLAIIERWRRGRYRSFRTARARKLMESNLHSLLQGFSGTADPDRALGRFDSFLAQLPAGVQLFSLFQSNPSLFMLIARIMGIAPVLAAMLSRRPHLIDALLDREFFNPLPEPAELKAELLRTLEKARDYQDVLDLARIWADEQKFRIGVQALEAISDVKEASIALTNLADVLVEGILPSVMDDYAVRHGRFPEGALAVIAMGKYGGRELSFGSDLDIVLLYEVRSASARSEGPRSVGPSQYYSGLGQALLTAFTALTPQGRLWEMDTRLRPSGSAGPLVVTCDTFSAYYHDAAWTWEHMALTRARLVATPVHLARKVHDTISKTLTARRNIDNLLPAVRDMRKRLVDEFPTTNPWNLKHVSGGLLDMEFIVQYLLLRHGEKHTDIFTSRLDDCIDNLMTIRVLDPKSGDLLKTAHGLYHCLQGLLRLTLGDDPNEEDFAPDLCAALARASGKTDFPALKKDLIAMQSRVHELYDCVIPERT